MATGFGILNIGLDPDLEEELRKQIISRAIQGGAVEESPGSLILAAEKVNKPADSEPGATVEKKQDRLPMAAQAPMVPRVPQRLQVPATPESFSPPSEFGLDKLVTVLGGLFSGNTLGEGILRAQAGAKAIDNNNMTMRALQAKGLDPAMAQLVTSNPDMMKAVIPQLFGGAKDWQIGEIYDQATGGKQKVMWNKNDPQQMVKIGGVAPDKADEMERRLEAQSAARQREADHKAEIARAAGVEKADRKTIDVAREDALSAGKLLDTAQQMRELRKKVPYAGGVGADMRTYLGQALPDGVGPFGIPGIPSQEEAGAAKALESLATQAQTLVRAKGEGAVSNYERQLFASAVPGAGMADAGANQVLDSWEALGRRRQERVKFLEAYKRENKNLEGAEEAWQRFVEEKPILENDGKGGFTLNKGNIGGWRAYLGSRGPSAGLTEVPAPASDTKPAKPRLRFNLKTGTFEE